MNWTFRNLGTVVCLSFAASVSAQNVATQATIWPTHAWPTGEPSAQGVDPDTLQGLDEEIRSGIFEKIDHVLVVRNGYAIFDEAYTQDYSRMTDGRDTTDHQYNYDHPNWHPFYQGTKLHTLQSVSKSVTSVLIGVALHRGELADVDVTVVDFFSDHAFLDEDARRQRMTIEDLLTMRAGLQWDEWTYSYEDPRNTTIQLEASHDWIQFILEQPMATEPGKVFVYNSGATVLLAAIIEKVSGKSFAEYVEDNLFTPLGITEYYWKKTPTGLADTEGGLYLKPHDLAKIGYLLLNDGIWDGRRLVPEGWVARSTHAVVADIMPDNPNSDRGYGYKWWVLEQDEDGRALVYAAMGFGGQSLIVVPKLELIAVFNGWNIHGRAPSLVNAFLQRVVAPLR